jgi:drug/metabolite transporter (DMT)-like permease
MWFVLAILSGIFYTGSSLITRHVLKTGRDSWAFSFFYSAVGALVTIPFVIGIYIYTGEIALADDAFGWGAMVLVGFVIVFHNFLNFRASNYLEASLVDTIRKFRLIWIFIFGVIVLDEAFSYWKLTGTVLTVLAGILIIVKFKKPKSIKGIMFAFSATFAFAAGIISYKFLFEYFSVWTLTLFIFLIPAIINFIIMPSVLPRVVKLAKDNGKFVYLACILGGIANLTMNAALMLGQATKVPAIIEAFLVATLIGEYLILKERKNLLVKLLAIAFATIGAVIIRLA